MKALLTLLFVALTSPAWATWTKVQCVKTDPCGTGAACNITVSSTGTGHVGVVSAFLRIGDHITSVSGGGTWTLCAASGCNKNHTDMAYNLLTSSGATTITVNFSASQTTPDVAVEFCEYSTTAGPPLLDVIGTVGSCSGNACSGLALTLTGTNDVITQTITNGSATISAISGTYTNPFDTYKTGNGALGGAINIASGAAPTWTVGGTGGGDIAAIAFKESPQPHRGYTQVF